MAKPAKPAAPAAFTPELDIKLDVTTETLVAVGVDNAVDTLEQFFREQRALGDDLGRKLAEARERRAAALNAIDAADEAAYLGEYAASELAFRALAHVPLDVAAADLAGYRASRAVVGLEKGVSRTFRAEFAYEGRDGKVKASFAFVRTGGYPAAAAAVDAEIALLEAEKARADGLAAEARKQLQNVPALERKIRARLGRHALANGGDRGEALLAAIKITENPRDQVLGLVGPAGRP